MKKLLKLSLLFAFTIFLSCATDSSEIIFHKSHEESRHSAPFSDAVETENLLFLTGQIGKDHKEGKLVEGGIQAETKQTIENIKAVLEQHKFCLLYTSPSPRDKRQSRMPSSA